MTIATGRTREMDIGKICRMGYLLPGLLNEAQELTDAQFRVAADFLESILDGMQAEGLRARAVDFKNVTLVSGTSDYVLTTDVIDVVGDAMFIDPDQVDVDHASGEVPIVAIGRDDWQLLSDKAMTGRPTMFYCHRVACPPTIKFWPIPGDEDAGTVRFQCHLLAADSNNSANTLDLERFFSQYIIWELAHQLAAHNSLNMGRVQYYGGQAAQKLEKCKTYAGQRTPAQAVVRHRTGWHR